MQRIAAATVGFTEVDEAPDFGLLLTDLQRGTYHTSNSWIALPSEYLTAPANLLPLVINVPVLAVTVTASAGGSALLLIVSGLTTAAPPPRTADPSPRCRFPDSDFAASS